MNADHLQANSILLNRALELLRSTEIPTYDGKHSCCIPELHIETWWAIPAPQTAEVCAAGAPFWCGRSNSDSSPRLSSANTCFEGILSPPRHPRLSSRKHKIPPPG